ECATTVQYSFWYQRWPPLDCLACGYPFASLTMLTLRRQTRLPYSWSPFPLNLLATWKKLASCSMRPKPDFKSTRGFILPVNLAATLLACSRQALAWQQANLL